MKRKTTYFLAGVLVVALLLAMSASALASDGSFTITIHPIRIMVNGEVFQPKDVNGNDVMVFTVLAMTPQQTPPPSTVQARTLHRKFPRPAMRISTPSGP